MKKTITKLVGLALIASTFQGMAAEPFVTITAKNYPAWVETAAEFLSTVEPGKDHQAKLEKSLRQSVGSSTFAGLDSDKPWQLAVWQKGMMQKPLSVIYAPVRDYDAYVRDRDPDAFSKNGHTALDGKSHAIIVMEDANQEPLTDAWKDELLAYAPKVTGKSEDWVRMDLNMNDEIRMQFTQGLAFAKMFTASMSKVDGPDGNPAKGLPPGYDPAALGQLLALYISLAEIVVQGLDELGVGLNFSDGELAIVENISATPSSEFAGWLKNNGMNVSSVVDKLDWDSPMAIAYALNDIPKIKEVFTKATVLGYKLQGMEADPALMEKMDDFIDTMLPIVTGVSLDAGKGLAFGAVYQMPGKSPEVLHEKIREITTDMMPLMSGEGKSYKSMKYTENVRKIGGVDVSEMEMVLNLDLPMYQAPGQKEGIEAMMPGGKMSMEMARKADMFYIASKGSLDKTLKIKGAKPPVTVGDTTVMAGAVNLVQMIRVFAGPNPMVPQQFKDAIQTMSDENATMTFSGDMDKELTIKVNVPVGVFGKIAEAGKKKD